MLDDNFRTGAPIANLSAKWLNEVARILKFLRVEWTNDTQPSIEKPPQPCAAAPWKIKIPRVSSEGESSTTTFTLPSTVAWDATQRCLVEKEMKFNGEYFEETGVTRTILDFKPVELAQVVASVQNTGSAIEQTQQTLQIYAPDGASVATDTGDFKTTTIIGLTPREANETTPYGDSTEV